MTRRSPRLTAWGMECVTITVVRRPSRTNSSVRRITKSAARGSSAAVCSSSSRSSGRRRVAIKSVRAWRCPPDREPISFLRRSSSPMPRRRTRSVNSSDRRKKAFHPRVRRSPRRIARARFSPMDMEGAVPLKGFWNTRPMRAARRCSGHRVMSCPANSMRPRSTKKLPEMAFCRVDFPEPLVPMTTTKEPSSTLRSTPWRALTSFSVPG